MQVEIIDVECPYCGQNGILEVDPSAGESQEVTSDCEVCCRPIRFEISVDMAGIDEESDEPDDADDDFDDEDELCASESEETDDDDEDGLEAEDNYGREDAFESMTGAKKKSRKPVAKRKSDLQIQINAYREEDV